jgi:hypothetical protein
VHGQNVEYFFNVKTGEFYVMLTVYIGTIFFKITNLTRKFILVYVYFRPPLWSSGQSFWLQIQRSRVRFPALPYFLSSSRSGTGSTQPREVN